MKWFPSRPLLGVLAAAGKITACTDGSAPTALPRTHAGETATQSFDRAEKGVFTTMEWPGATPVDVDGALSSRVADEMTGRSVTPT